jgi:RloB-like protein
VVAGTARSFRRCAVALGRLDAVSDLLPNAALLLYSFVPAAYGTEPLHVVNYAEALSLRGDRALAIAPRCFDRVIAVFDRDEHRTYHAALEKAAALDRHMTNDEKARVPFDTVVSVPCFELWLQLHFEDALAPLHRDESLQRLQVHLPGYAKGHPVA